MKDFREKWLLNIGDTIRAGEHVYAITGAPLGFGGSAVLYPARRNGSELSYAIKECFPNCSEIFIRKDGVVTVISEDDGEGRVLLKFYREMFKKECATGQSIRNFTGRSIGMWDTLSVQTITTENQTYDASQGIYALLERMDGKGCSLSDVLKECRKEVSSLYALRTGGLPNIYTTACIMEQILRAVQGVHESGYMFGDIQVNNIFFMDSRLGEGEIGFGCLFDFGCARTLLEDGYTEEITDCKVFSTQGYVPPEVLYHNNGHLRLGKQADVYSAGKLMLLCLLTDGQDLTESSISMKRLLQPYHGKKIGCGGKQLDLVNRILEKALQVEPDKRYKDAKDMLADILELKKLTEPPKFRLSNNMSSPDYFVPGSRENEIRVLKDSMLKGEHPMLWGYGGMGKTETAIELARCMDNGKGAYLVHFKNSMRETIINLQFSGYHYEPDKNGLSLEEQEEQKYQEKLNLLKDYFEDSIIIIDNFDNEEKTLDELRREKGFTDLTGLNLHLIFTTRYPVGREEWEIAELDREDLLKIMKHYVRNISLSDEMMYELIEAVGRHTLTITLMAKTLEESWGTVTPEMILKAFRNASISESCFPEVVSDQNRIYGQDEIYQHLKVLFNLSGLSADEKKILSCAILLPQSGMDVMLFMECLEEAEQKNLRKLVAKGWLRRKEGNLLTIHPIICQVCREELRPSDEVCQEFLDSLWKKYDDTDYNFSRYAQMAECFSKATEYLNDGNGNYASYAGIFYSEIGEYQKSLEYYQKALKTRERILLPNHPDIVVTYNNIGLAYGYLGEYEKELKYYKDALRKDEKFLSLTHPDTATIYQNIGCAYGHLGKYKKGLEYLEKGLKVTEEVLPPNHPKIAVTYSNIGVTYGGLGEYEKSLEYFQKALTICNEVQSPIHPEMAMIYSNIGTAYENLRRYDKALKNYKKSLRICEKNFLQDHPKIATIYNNIGSAYKELNEYQKALEHYKKSLRIKEEILPSNHPEVADTCNNIGNVYIELGEYDKALEYYKKSLRIRKEILPSNHLDIAIIYSNIGLSYKKLEEYGCALENYQKALRIKQEILPPIHMDIIAMYNNIGIVYGELGEYEKELEYYQKALRILEEGLLPNYSNIAIMYNNIGSAYGKLGEYENGMMCYQKALRILEEVLPPNYPNIATQYDIIGYTYGELKEYENELEYRQKSLRIHEKILSSNHPDMAIKHNSIGYVYGELGKYESALEHYQKALRIREEFFAPTDEVIIATYNNIGSAYIGLNEYEEAFEWLNKAYLLGGSTAMNNLGWMYLHGYGCEKDYFKAVELFEAAVNSEVPCGNAYMHLGEIYSGLEDTENVIQYDIEKALHYYQKAKELGVQGINEIIEQLMKDC